MPARWSPHIAPSVEPIGLTEAKLHLRLATTAAGAEAYTDEDDFISVCIMAARYAAEAETCRAMALQSWDLYLDEWPTENYIEFPMPPLQSVEHVKWTDTDGTETTFTDYTVDTSSDHGRIVLDYGYSWPSGTLAPNNPINIRFWCGYVTSFVAEPITNILTATNHQFSDGDKTVVSFSGGSLPTGLSAGATYYARDVLDDSLKLAATSGGSAIDFTTAGSGTLFLGAVPAPILTGMKLIITDLYEERANTVVGRSTSALPAELPRAASHWFSMCSAKRF